MLNKNFLKWKDEILGKTCERKRCTKLIAVLLTDYRRTDIVFLREAAKKLPFLVARPLRPYPLPPRAQGAHFFGFFYELQKKFFFLSGSAFFSPPLPFFVAGPLKKIAFFVSDIFPVAC